MWSVKKELSIIVPAYNEETNLEKTISEAYSCAVKCLEAFELMVVNDGSTDRTGQIADALAIQFPSAMKVVHFKQNRGVGAAYREGLKLARFPFLTVIPGDNAFHQTGVERVFSLVGTSNLIVSYRSNPQARSALRRWLSRFATLLMRGLTGSHIRDAHSLFVFPVDLARKIHVPLGYGYHLESLSRLLLMTDSFVEVPVELNPKPDQSSGVMKLGTVMKLAGTVLRLYALRIAGRLTPRA